jgi:DNA-binding response OmpR family regulator
MVEGENHARILLVEESPTDRALLERALRNCVTVVLDAEAALEAARRQPFAAVLLGDALPGRRALDVLRDLHAAVGETPIVFMTESVTKGVTEATAVGRQADDTITTLADTLAESARAAAQIVVAVGQQSTGMTQIHEAMRNIDQVTRQTIAATRQTEQAAQNLNALGNDLAALSGV